MMYILLFNIWSIMSSSPYIYVTMGHIVILVASVSNPNDYLMKYQVSLCPACSCTGSTWEVVGLWHVVAEVCMLNREIETDQLPPTEFTGFTFYLFEWPCRDNVCYCYIISSYIKLISDPLLTNPSHASWKAVGNMAASVGTIFESALEESSWGEMKTRTYKYLPIFYHKAVEQHQQNRSKKNLR